MNIKKAGIGLLGLAAIMSLSSCFIFGPRHGDRRPPHQQNDGGRYNDRDRRDNNGGGR